MGSSTAPPLRSICNYKGRVKARVKASQIHKTQLGGPNFRFGSRQIPSGVPSNPEPGPVKFRAGSENFRTGPCQNPPPHKENSGNSRGIFRPGASFFRLKFPFPVFSTLLYPPLRGGPCYNRAKECVPAGAAVWLKYGTAPARLRDAFPVHPLLPGGARGWPS